MTLSNHTDDTMNALDAPTAALVRQSARITAGTEESVRAGFAECASAGVRGEWLEELVLQAYLFAGFPRALNAAREWRRMSGSRGASAVEVKGYDDVAGLRASGEKTCAIVYGEF